MTTSTYIQKVRDLCAFDLDLILGEDTTDADIVVSLNDAQRRLGTLAPIFDPAVTLTIPVISSGPCVLDLSSTSVCSRKVWKVLDVVLNGLALKTKLCTKPGPWSLAELEDSFPQWRTDAPGLPTRWARLSDRSIVLHPAPDNHQPSSNNFISGHVLPADLDSTAPTGVSELPGELTDHLYRLAASIQAESVATEGRQLAKIQKWQTDALAAAAAIGQRDRSAKSPLGTTSGRGYRDRMWA